MDNAEPGSRTVQGGALNGSQFGQLSDEQLKKAAKRYPADPTLQKFAKARITILELEAREDPVPCEPIRPPVVAVQALPSLSLQSRIKKFIVKQIWTMLTHPIWKFICLLALLVFMTRPAFMNALTKFMVKSTRVAIRHVIALITLLLENIADEVIYQLEFVLRDALPGMPELKEVQHSRVLTIAHLVSAGVGASFVYIINVVQMRRTALPWATRFAGSSPPPPHHTPTGGLGKGKNLCRPMHCCLPSCMHSCLIDIFMCCQNGITHTTYLSAPFASKKRHAVPRMQCEENTYIYVGFGWKFQDGEFWSFAILNGADAMHLMTVELVANLQA